MKALTIAEALGEGVVSVPITLWDGLRRTVEGYEVGNTEQEVKVAQQDDRALIALKGVFKYGIRDYNSPISKAIRIILIHFYESLSVDQKEKIKQALVKKGVYLTSKMITSSELGH